MKGPISVFFIQFQPLLVVITLLLSTQLNASLIEQECRQTPNYDLCVTSLTSDPTSSTADARGLALIMVNQVKAKASGAMDIIHQLLDDPKVKQPSTSCSNRYRVILNGLVPAAIYALQTGEPKIAVNGMNGAGIEANSCENDFQGDSRMTSWNNAVHDLSAVAAALIRLLF